MTSMKELVAFNDEVVSLIRAGVPVDLGLSQLDDDPEVANKQINAALSVQMENGVSLLDAVSDPNQAFPPIWQSVVSAGLRCGRLPAALEALNRHAQSLVDMGRSLRRAFFYPLFICGLAYLLFVASCLFVPPHYYQVLGEFTSGGGIVYRVVQGLRNTLPVWIAIPPILLVALLLIGYRTHGSRTIWFRGLPKLIRWFPGVSQVTADQRCASFAELLALLLEHEVPLHEAIRMAARASGDTKLMLAALEIASGDEQDEARYFPPFLHWALTSSAETSDLVTTLRIASKTYQHRAESRIKWLRRAAPMLTCIFLAGGVTLMYCLSIFVPFVQFMKALN